MLAYFTIAGRLNRQFVEEQLNLLIAVALLFGSDAQSRQQQGDVRPHRLLCAGSRPGWLLTKLRQHLVCLKTSDAMVLEHALDKVSGASVWKQEVLAPRRVGGPQMVGAYVGVVDVEGYLHLLATADGAYVGRLATDGRPPTTQPEPLAGSGLWLSDAGTLFSVTAR